MIIYFGGLRSGEEEEEEEEGVSRKSKAKRCFPPSTLSREREREREREKGKQRGRNRKNSPQLLEHREQLRLHVLLPDVERARIHEPLLQSEGGLSRLGGGHGRRCERAGDEEAGENVIVLPAAEPDSDLNGGIEVKEGEARGLIRMRKRGEKGRRRKRRGRRRRGCENKSAARKKERESSSKSCFYFYSP